MLRLLLALFGVVGKDVANRLHRHLRTPRLESYYVATSILSLTKVMVSLETKADVKISFMGCCEILDLVSET